MYLLFLIFFTTFANALCMEKRPRKRSKQEIESSSNTGYDEHILSLEQKHFNQAISNLKKHFRKYKYMQNQINTIKTQGIKSVTENAIEESINNLHTEYTLSQEVIIRKSSRNLQALTMPLHNQLFQMLNEEEEERTFLIKTYILYTMHYPQETNLAIKNFSLIPKISPEKNSIAAVDGDSLEDLEACNTTRSLGLPPYKNNCGTKKFCLLQ